MDKTVVRIFILGFIWVAAGIITNLIQEEDGAGVLALAIGLSIESVALIVFFWKKIKTKQ